MTGTDQLIYENSMYTVVAGPSVISDDFVGRMCYKVTSKAYDVIEMETTVLMRALFSADDFEAHVQAHNSGQGRAEGVVLS